MFKFPEPFAHMLHESPEWNPYWQELLQVAELTEDEALSAPYDDYDVLAAMQDAMYEVMERYPEKKIRPLDTLFYRHHLLEAKLYLLEQSRKENQGDA